MRLLLIRHGETDWNATLRYQGHAAIPLNEQGREQARIVAERLQRFYQPAALYSSDILRATETAMLIGEALGLTPIAMPDLREIDVGQWEGLTPEQLYRRFPDHMREFERDPARTVRIGGESYAQLQQRAMRAMQQITAQHAAHDTVLAVSHGGTIRALLCHVIGLDLGYFGRMWIDNGSLTELRHGSSGWRLVRLNDAAHLEGTTLARGE
ncbi:MAG TPA: histidine phosphatase family protein [Roseiflexaceae bacterium]|nr:histidine phosphatase family protein [Roseiflexaceae bacterium]HMP39999.1 histidine phosphatase family protein [Roseiflexaceae bacterium]